MHRPRGHPPLLPQPPHITTTSLSPCPSCCRRLRVPYHHTRRALVALVAFPSHFPHPIITTSSVSSCLSFHLSLEKTVADYSVAVMARAYDTREYELTVRQEPKQARMCGVGGKGPSPLPLFTYLLRPTFSHPLTTTSTSLNDRMASFRDVKKTYMLSYNLRVSLSWSASAYTDSIRSICAHCSRRLSLHHFQLNHASYMRPSRTIACCMLFVPPIIEIFISPPPYCIRLRFDASCLELLILT